MMASLQHALLRRLIAMKVFVYAFKSTTRPELYGYTRHAGGANLPERDGPWKDYRSHELDPDDGNVNTDKVLMATKGGGYYLTAAELKFD